jgi:hypothetical protein
VIIRNTLKSVPFLLKEKQMTQQEQVWYKTNEEKLRSLIADEAKMMPMLDNMQATIKQLKAKQAFRLALLNQLLEELTDKE